MTSRLTSRVTSRSISLVRGTFLQSLALWVVGIGMVCHVSAGPVSSAPYNASARTQVQSDRSIGRSSEAPPRRVQLADARNIELWTTGWAFVRETSDGLRIYQRPGDAGIPEVRGIVSSDVKASAIYRTVTDYARFAEFFPNMVFSDVVRLEPDGALLHQRLRFPVVFSEREFQIRVTENPSERFVSWRRVPLASVPDDAVEPSSLRGSWRIVAEDAGGSTAVYTVFMNPSGEVPTWLIDVGMNAFLPEVVRAVLARARGAGGTGRDTSAADFDIGQ